MISPASSFLLLPSLLAVEVATHVQHVGAVPDMLAQPALISARASGGSVLLAVTQADQRLLTSGERGIVLFSDDGAISWQQAARLMLESAQKNAIAHDDDKTRRQLSDAPQAGEVLRSTDQGRSFKVLPVVHPFPFSSVAQAANEDLILPETRGISRVSIQQARQ